MHETIDVIGAEAPQLSEVLVPGARPVWGSSASTAPCPAVAAGLPTLTDKGYTGVGIGVEVPTKGKDLSVDNQSRNLLVTGLWTPAERANALLKSSFTALRRVTLSAHNAPATSSPPHFILTIHRGRW